MGVTQNSYIPRAREVSDLKVKGATVYNYYLRHGASTYSH